MKELEVWILSYLFNSVWQLPLLVSAGWMAVRMLRAAGPTVEHRVWVVVLLLQTLLPATSLLPWAWLQNLPLWRGLANKSIEAQVSIAMDSGTVSGSSYLPGTALTVVVILYVAISAWFVARFVWRMIMLSSLRRKAVTVVLPREITEFWVRSSRKFAITNVSLASSSRIAGPVTMGASRKLVLLPTGMIEALQEQDLYTVIAHEFSHICRHDFIKNLSYELISLPVAYHPVLWFTRARIMETREMICDEMAAEINGKENYARSLLRLARLLVEGVPTAIPHTIGIFDANAFERRVMNLSNRQQKPSGLRKLAFMGASALLGITVSASAMAVAVHIHPAATGGHTDAKAPRQLSISSDVIASNLINKVNPVYDPAAKKAKIQGTVVLSAVIGKDGNVENLRAVSGPQKLQQSALDAVRQWKYKPYLLNGDPVEVLTTINIIYALSGH